MRAKAMSFDLDGRFQQAVDAIAFGYIEDKDTIELKKLVKEELRLRADSQCSPVSFCTESLNQLLQESPDLVNMIDRSGNDLLKIAKRRGSAVGEAAIRVIEEHLIGSAKLTSSRVQLVEKVAEDSTTKWRGRFASDGDLVNASRAKNIIQTYSPVIGHAKKVMERREGVSSNQDLQAIAKTESERIRIKLYKRLGIGEDTAIDFTK